VLPQATSNSAAPVDPTKVRIRITSEFYSALYPSDSLDSLCTQIEGVEVPMTPDDRRLFIANQHPPLSPINMGPWSKYRRGSGVPKGRKFEALVRIRR
jgi:hypothetical protein